ncbi:hypothetical protein PQX77_015065 [Marasmius sp. AFHP31]|nr:hypothetical protein PQX77_015065 [Marasmius sp. AFHP31]
MQQSSSSSVIWAHLLRKENVPLPTSTSDVPLPPLGPVDKNATSTRILLHDTQANLQQFSERIDKMTQSLNGTKQEISAVKVLFQEEHERLVGELVDLVNRCQTEIQKPLGQPAQSDKLDQAQKNLELRLENLDRRLDIVQTLQSTHSQTLQTQSQLLQSLKDQQSTILASVSPLLPLLQALPLQIESIRNAVNEVTSKALDSAKVTATRTPSVTFRTSVSPNTPTLPSSQPGSTGRKRRRTSENAQEVTTLHQTPTVTKAAVMASLVRGSSLARRDSTTTWQPLAPLVPSTPRSNAPPTSSNQGAEASNTGAGALFRATPERPDSVFRIPAVPNPCSALKTSANIAEKRGSPLPSSVQEVAAPAAPSRLSTPLSKSKNPVAEARPLGAPYAQAMALPASLNSKMQTPGLRRQEVGNPSPAAGPQPHPLLVRNSTLRVPSTGPRPATAAPLRQRRSPFREGRRFIPLDDSDDSDEQ